MSRCKRVCFSLIFAVFAVPSFAEDLTLSVNFRRPISVTSDKFLSLTVDPEILFDDANALSANSEKSRNMARALAPAYVRFAGPRSNSFEFSSTKFPRNGNGDSVLSESEWIKAHRWAEETGLDIIACIPPDSVQNDSEKTEDSEKAMKIVSFSDQQDYNTSWQLGYECQTRCNVTGSDLGKRVLRLRRILNEFPRYQNSVLIGPDIVSYNTKGQQEFLEDYLSIAGPALTAITWNPDFADVTFDDEGLTIERDTLLAEKNDLYRTIGRFAAKRPLWIAESKPEERKDQFLGALIWTRRLGSAAKSRAEVVMRQPSNLIRPTPDYWVSVLHKSLIGRQVFDAKTQTGSRSNVHLYCHCTKPSTVYGKGAVTIFGVNLTPNDARVNLRGTQIKTVHEYILLPGFDAPIRLFAETVLLNNETLRLTNDAQIPQINPVVLTDPKGVDLKLPSGGIGFWVLPDLKIKSCIENDDDDSSEKVPSRASLKRTNQADAPENSSEENEEKFHVTRSASDRKSSVKRGAAERGLRRHQVARDLKRLKKFMDKKIEYYGPIRRSKRDLNKKVTEAPLTVKRESLLKKRSRSDDVRERKIRRKEDIKKEVQPSLVNRRTSDSGENTFYGFFKSDPLDGFPEGDVFLATGDSSLSADYDYVKDDERSVERPESLRVTIPVDYVESEDVWLEDDDDYHGYAPNEFFEQVKRPSFRATGNSGSNAELWEAETRHQTGQDDADAEVQDGTLEETDAPGTEGALNKLTGYYDSAKSDDVQKRPKRTNNDLNSIFNQEMIKADEDNSKDCQCRVIRGFKEECVNCRLKRATGVQSAAEDQGKIGQFETTTGIYFDQSIHDRFPDGGKTEGSSENISGATLATEAATLPQENSGDSFFEMSTRPEEFFRDDTAKDEEEATADTVESVTEYASNLGEYSTPPLGENETEEGIAATSEKTEEVEKGSESSATTFEPTTLSEKEIAEQDQSSYDHDRTAAGTLSRRVAENEKSSTMRLYKARTISESPSIQPANEPATENKKLASRATNYSRKSNYRKEEEKPRPPGVSRPLKFILALAKHNRNNNNRGNRVMEIPVRISDDRRDDDHQKKRSEQIARLKQKLREKREKILQQYREEVLQMVDKITDEEQRDGRRREALEKIKQSDDFKDLIDREKLAYILMYNPINYGAVRREAEADKSVDKRYVPAGQLLRSRNVRERIVHPRDRNDRDPTIVQTSSPALSRLIRLKDFARNARPKYDENKRGAGKSYLAIVEDVKNPRVFRYRERSQDERKRSVRYQPYEYAGDESGQESTEDEEQSDRSSARKIYVIDPSQYKGGEPTLQIHEDSSESTLVGEQLLKDDLYRLVWQSMFGRALNEGADAAESLPARNRQQGGSYEGDGFLGGLANAARESAGENNGDGKAEGERVKQVFQDAKTESYDSRAAPEAGERVESYRSGPIERRKEDVNSEPAANANNEGSPRNRRDTGNQIKNGYFERAPSTLYNGDKKIKLGNYVFLKGESNEDSPKVARIVKENGYYKAIPVFSNIDDYFQLASGGKIGGKNRQDSREYLEIVVPEGLKRGIVGENSSESGTSELEKSAEKSDASQSDERSMSEEDEGEGSGENDYINLSDIFILKKPKMIIPWRNKGFSRLRRQAEHQIVDKNELSELHDLEQSSSPTPLTSKYDEIDKWIFQKKMFPNKHSVKKNLIKSYMKEEKKLNIKNLRDQGLIEEALPKLENVIVAGIQKAENLTESVEQLIENTEKFNQTTKTDKSDDFAGAIYNIRTRDFFHNVMMNVKKIFHFLGGVTHIFHGF